MASVGLHIAQETQRWDRGGHLCVDVLSPDMLDQ